MRLSISATKFHHGRRVLGDTEFRIEGTQFRNFNAASIVLQAVTTLCKGNTLNLSSFTFGTLVKTKI